MSELYPRMGERRAEKAAAMDAAIEFEDAWPVDGDEIKDHRSKIIDSKGLTMIDRTELLELDVACGELAKAEERVRTICRRIGGDGAVAVTAAEAAGTQSPRGHQTKSRGEGLGRGHRAPVEGDLPPGAERQSWRKIVCPVCSERLGSRVYQGKRYPVLHKNADSGQPCKGSFQVVPDAGNPGAS